MAHCIALFQGEYAVRIEVDVDIADVSPSNPSNCAPAAGPGAAAPTALLAPLPVLTSLMAAAAVAACGGGGGGDSAAPLSAASPPPGPQPPATAPPAPTPPAPTAPTPPAPAPSPPAPAGPFTNAEAARLIGQGGFGANRAELERVIALGSPAAWLDEQLAMPRAQGFFAWAEVNAPGGGPPTVDYATWRKFLGSQDQLRQRMVFALSQILVVGMSSLPGTDRGYSVLAYLDLLEQHAFGNFRALLEAATLSTAMGTCLSMRGSRKADAAGRRPDENYAREVMQLFTIGLVELNVDGTPKLQGGAPVDTYGEADVSGLARAFTGWDYTVDKIGRTSPMTSFRDRHETGEKSFLGITVPANTSATDTLRITLDRLFNHPNVGPFIATRLIQRLVTSNPSPAYVGRVATVFNNNGAGVRGDLAAVLRAILLDTEARNTAAAQADANGGRLREPILRFAAWGRACNANSASDKWALLDTSDPATRLGQSAMRSPSVFNFYRPGYVPPNTSIASAGKVAPEFQITTETSVAGYLNFMQGAISTGNGVLASDIKPDYTAWLPLATDPAALAAEANLLLAANQLSAARVTIIRDALAAMPSATDIQRLNRVYVALLLTVAAPEFLVAK